MIRTLAANFAPNLEWFKDNRNTPAETASDEMVMGAA